MTDRAKAQAVRPLTERRVVHRLPAGDGVNVDGALARLFGVALIDALERRRAERGEGFSTRSEL